MKLRTKASIIRGTATLIFTAAICLSCFISQELPGGVPITVQNFFVILASLILGGLQGAGSVGLFLMLGIAGAPVFSGAKGGWEVFIGPTGGFLWGYFLAAAAAGLIAGSPHEFERKFNIKNWLRLALASLVGFILVYVPGIPWFIHIMGENGNKMTFPKSLEYTAYPFLNLDFIKFVITVPLAALTRPVAAKILYPDDEKELEELMAEMENRKELRDKIIKRFNKKNSKNKK